MHGFRALLLMATLVTNSAFTEDEAKFTIGDSMNHKPATDINHSKKIDKQSGLVEMVKIIDQLIADDISTKSKFREDRFVDRIRSHLPSRSKRSVAVDDPFAPGFLCGGKSRVGRVVGGTTAEPNSLPWIAYLKLINTSNKLCAGVLISNQWMITAAHCAVYQNTGTMHGMYVVLGLHDIEECFKERPTIIKIDTKSIFIHPDYNNDYLFNDLCLVKFPEPVSYTSNIKPVCLPEQNTIATLGDTCTAAGWGLISMKPKILPKELQKLKVAIKICQDMGDVTAICTGSPDLSDFTTRDTCAGDSGGPLVCTKKNDVQTVMGILSAGSEDCDGWTIYAKYMKVTYYLRWIKETIKYNSFRK